ncbi:hypothetical protein Tco_1408505 [Tanacetum coccineum]
MTTLAEFMIIAGADNHPPMLEKTLYDSWKSRIELYIENRENERMILNSLQNGPLVWPTVVEEDGTARTKKYEEHSITEKLQADCLAIPVFNQGDDPIACLNKAMAFLTTVASLRFPSTNNQLRTSSNLRNQATIQDGKVTAQQVQGKQGQSYAGNSYMGNATSYRGNNAEGQAKTKDLDAYDSDCNDVTNAKVVLMANISNYGSDIISKVPHHEPYHTDMDNQSVYTMQGLEQTSVADFTDNEITSDSNIIPYSQYLQETQLAAVQDTNLYAQQDSMILSMIEQMSKQMINHVNNWEKANQEKNNESLIAKLERYKERVETFEQRLNIDLSTREK